MFDAGRAARPRDAAAVVPEPASVLEHFALQTARLNYGPPINERRRSCGAGFPRRVCSTWAGRNGGRVMPSKALRLALPGLFLSLVAAAPAMARSLPSGPAACFRTISYPGPAAASPRAAADRCSAPRETMVHGGWMTHAIMTVGEAGRRIEEPRAATGWRTSHPSFAVPPTYR
jgi:hypothetical protein